MANFMKQLIIIVAGLALSFSAIAGSTNDANDDALTDQNPKQCLNELELDKESEAENNDDKAKKEPSWFDKLVKQHKLGSLHFQDLIELFH